MACGGCERRRKMLARAARRLIGREAGDGEGGEKGREADEAQAKEQAPGRAQEEPGVVPEG